jgi:tripartite-type tricarboxylate transporter receptor subunit TctC
MAALLSGEVNMALVGVATALPHVKAGKIKPIGVSGATRSPILPDIPTLSEAGVRGYEFAGWYGIFAPAHTPRAIVVKINNDIVKALQQPEAMQRLAAMGFQPEGGSADDFAKYFRAEVVKWRKVIQEAGIAAN